MIDDTECDGTIDWQYEFSAMCTNDLWNAQIFEWLKTLPDKHSVFVDYHEYTKKVRFIIKTRHIVNGKHLEWDIFEDVRLFFNRLKKLREDYCNFIVDNA